MCVCAYENTGVCVSSQEVISADSVLMSGYTAEAYLMRVSVCVSELETVGEITRFSSSQTPAPTMTSHCKRACDCE